MGPLAAVIEVALDHPLLLTTYAGLLATLGYIARQLLALAREVRALRTDLTWHMRQEEEGQLADRHEREERQEQHDRRLEQIDGRLDGIDAKLADGAVQFARLEERLSRAP